MVRYRAWCDEARAAAGIRRKADCGDVIGVYCFAHFALPKDKGRAGKIHRQKSDVDNLEKGLLDALFADDSRIAFCHGVKLWCEEGDSPRVDVFLIRA